MVQNNKIHTYIRIDASGRDIPGTNVLRKKIPVTGKWRQTDAYECCNPITLLTTSPVDFGLTSVTFTLLCDDVDVATLTVTDTTTDLATLVASLNDNFSMYGVFTANGTTDVDLQVTPGLPEALCPDGTLTFTVTGT